MKQIFGATILALIMTAGGAQAQVSCSTTASGYRCSDGSSGRLSGNTMFHDNGETTRQLGNSYFHSDGTSTRRLGNSYFNSDGTSCRQIGSRVVCH